MSGSGADRCRRATAGALRGAPAHPHPAADRPQHGAPGRRRAVPVQRRTRRTRRASASRPSPASPSPSASTATRRCANTCARWRPPRASEADGRLQRVPAGGRRPRSRTCAISPTCSPTPRPSSGRAGCSPPPARCPCSVCGPRPRRPVRLRLLRRQGPSRRTPAGRGRHHAPDRIDAARRAGASALLCFALPRHPREVVEALAYARAAGLTVVTVADSAFAPVAAQVRPADPRRGRHRASPSTPPARRCCSAGCCWRRCATTCRTRRRGWRSSTRGRRRGGCSWSSAGRRSRNDSRTRHRLCEQDTGRPGANPDVAVPHAALQNPPLASAPEGHPRRGFAEGGADVARGGQGLARVAVVVRAGSGAHVVARGDSPRVSGVLVPGLTGTPDRGAGGAALFHRHRGRGRLVRRKRYVALAGGAATRAGKHDVLQDRAVTVRNWRRGHRWWLLLAFVGGPGLSFALPPRPARMLLAGAGAGLRLKAAWLGRLERPAASLLWVRVDWLGRGAGPGGQAGQGLSATGIAAGDAAPGGARRRGDVLGVGRAAPRPVRPPGPPRSSSAGAWPSRGSTRLASSTR